MNIDIWSVWGGGEEKRTARRRRMRVRRKLCECPLPQPQPQSPPWHPGAGQQPRQRRHSVNTSVGEESEQVFVLSGIGIGIFYQSTNADTYIDIIQRTFTKSYMHSRQGNQISTGLFTTGPPSTMTGQLHSITAFTSYGFFMSRQILRGRGQRQYRKNTRSYGKKN